MKIMNQLFSYNRVYRLFSFSKNSYTYKSIFEKRFSAKHHLVFRFCRHKTGKKFTFFFIPFVRQPSEKLFVSDKKDRNSCNNYKRFLAGCIYVSSHVKCNNDFE